MQIGGDVDGHVFPFGMQAAAQTACKEFNYLLLNSFYNLRLFGIVFYGGAHNYGSLHRHIGELACSMGL